MREREVGAGHAGARGGRGSRRAGSVGARAWRATVVAAVGSIAQHIATASTSRTAAATTGRTPPTLPTLNLKPAEGQGVLDQGADSSAFGTSASSSARLHGGLVAVVAPVDRALHLVAVPDADRTT